jgi:3-(3-hydroxy-phenyl)propionate hydroxylase
MTATYFDYRHYPPRLPPLRDGVDATRHRVAIVGGGPIGLALALGLARYGVPSVLLEADDTVCVGSRAACISRRSLEIFAALGCAAPMLAKGLAWTGGRSFHRDTEVFRLAMPHDEHQRFPPMINLQQCYAEQYLADAVEEAGALVDLRWQSRVAAVKARDDGVTLAVETPLGAYRLAAERVVACDGARSVVRQALGLKLEGTQYEGRYVIVDILLRSDYPTERRAWFDPPSNPGSTLLMHKQPDDIWRIDYQLADDEDPDEAVKPQNVLPRVASHLAMIGERDDWEPVWISMYKANALTLPAYRHGRVLFAGDAAHLVPIFGVRGMNSGIDDAHNLAWKLAFVDRGLAPESLLDSYSAERVYATQENLRYATKSTEFMAPPSHGFALMRQAVLSLAAEHAWVRPLINPRQTSAIAFHDSPLNAAPERSQAFAHGPRPGEVLPECPVDMPDGGAGHLTALPGPGFTALVFARDGAVAPVLAAALERLRAGAVPFAVIVIAAARAVASSPWPVAVDRTGRAAALFDAAAGSVYLVRPDGHVCARWRDGAAAEIEQAVRRALGYARSDDDRRAA